MPLKARTFSITIGGAQYSGITGTLISTGAVSQLVAPFGSGTYACGSESFQYYVGTDGRFRPCTHVLTETKFSDCTGKLYAPGSLYLLALSRDSGSNPSDAISLGELPVTAISDSQWSAYDNQALVSMLPSMASGFSLVNFLIELKDFRRLAQAFWNRRGIFQALLGVDDDRTFAGVLHQPLRSLSQVYLNYSFNWRPFVSDLMAIYKRLVSTRRRLIELWGRQGKPSTRHYSLPITTGANVEWSAYTADLPHSGSAYYNDSGATQLRVVRRSRYRYVKVPMYHATCRFTYEVPGVLSLIRQIDGWLDAFGVRLDPSIIWNAIPFSFMVDWVVDVGGFLRRFSSDNLGLRVSIEDFCSSVSSVAYKETELTAVRQSGSTVISRSSPIISHRNIRSTYTRRTGIPNLYSALRTSGLSTTEASLGSALLIANQKRR